MCICGWLLEFVCTTCMLGSMEAEKDNWISWIWCFRTPCPLQNQQSTCPPSICPALSLRFCFVFKLKESIFIDFDFIPCLNKGFKFKFLSLMPFLFIFIFFLYHFHQPINMLFLAYKKWAGPGCSFL